MSTAELTSRAHPDAPASLASRGVVSPVTVPCHSSLLSHQQLCSPATTASTLLEACESQTSFAVLSVLSLLPDCFGFLHSLCLVTDEVVSLVVAE